MSTPAPWRITKDRSSNDRRITSDVTAHIAKVYDWAEVGEANARLIAAAPTMYAALQSVQNWLLANGELKDDGITHPLFIKANNEVAAALKLAEEGE